MAEFRLACWRIAGLARAISDAHALGVPEGPHREPWGPPYHREAVWIFAQTLPVSYQREVASLFRHSVDEAHGRNIPSDLSEDWLIVVSYMHNASDAITEWLVSQDSKAATSDPTPELEDHTPLVVRFDLLAGLVAQQGAERLEKAAVAVQRYAGAVPAVALDDHERRILTAVASGTAVVDMAAEFGYSERSMYRELRRLFDALGVPDRVHAVRKAAAEGLLDDTR